MEAYGIESSVLDGKKEFNELFKFVKKQSYELDSYEIEKEIFKRLMKIGLSALKLYFAEKGTGDIGKKIKYGKDFLTKKWDLRYKKYFSVFGKLDIGRTYYYKKGCKGVIPLDTEANLPENSYSYLLQEWMNLFSMKSSFLEASLSLEALLGIKVSKSRLEDISRKSSISYQDFYSRKEIPKEKEEGALQVISFDGKGVPLIKREAAKIKPRLDRGERKQRMKEALVGVSYTVEKNNRTPIEVRDNLMSPEKIKKQKKKKLVKAKNIRRLASLEQPKEEIMKQIIFDAGKRDPSREKQWILIMDGALGLWKKAENLLQKENYVGILDIIHVNGYLWNCANALFGDGNYFCKIWVSRYLRQILQGDVYGVIEDFKKMLSSKRKYEEYAEDTIKTTIKYFKNHLKWMKYDQYLKFGYPIGSGVVEAACTFVIKKRMEGNGRRWSTKGAEAILLLRSVYTSDDWNEYWRHHRTQENIRLHGNAYHILGFKKSLENKKAS